MAKVYFLYGDAIFRQFQAVGPEQIDKKAGMLQKLQEAYTASAQLGRAWAIAGMFRLGRALELLADSLDSMPEPPGLKERERAELKNALAKQSKELRQGSSEAFETCVKKARELDIFTPFTYGCIDPRIAMPAPTAPLGPDRVKVFRDALARNATDAVALEGLGQAYLQAGDMRRARLTFGRLIEVDENRASGHGALGFVLLRLGELELAASALKRALEIDSRDEKARANLASLMCKFGDRDSAKAELKRLRGNPAGPDVDPGYMACRQ